MAIQTYGLNYQGSKNKIAEWVVDHLPYGKNFYDLFGGGGAVTHAAILSGKFKNFILNDINPLCQCFVKAAHGDYTDAELFRWRSRQKELTIISEYYMPSEAFIPIAQTTICCTLSATNNAKQAVEKLYIPKHQWGLYKQKQGLLF